MSPAAKALYNRLVAEKINNEDFRIEVLEHFYDENFAIHKIGIRALPYDLSRLGETPEDIKQLSAYVIEEDFKLVIDEYNRVFHQPAQRGSLSGWNNIDKIVYDSMTLAADSFISSKIKVGDGVVSTFNDKT